MFDTVGSQFNFSVAAGLPETFRVSVWRGAEGVSLANATFQAACYEPHGDEPGELVAVLPVEHDDKSNAVRISVPELPPGHYGWELRVTGADGKECRLLYGVLTALTAAELKQVVQDAEESELRELCVTLGDDTAAQLLLRWQSYNAASSLAADALEAAQRAEQAAADAKAEMDRVSGVLAQVEEFRVFMVRWKNEVSEVLVMNPVTGTIWVGNYDTGQPYRGEDGKAPRVNVYGYWEVYENGAWKTLPYKAIGKDGMDGSKVRRVLISSADELPEREEQGVIYYVPQTEPGVVGTTETPNWDNWNAFLVPAEVVPSGIVNLIAPEAMNSNNTPVYMQVRATLEGKTTVLAVSTNAATWAAGDDIEWRFAAPVSIPAGATIGLWLTLGNEPIAGDMPVPGVAVQNATGAGSGDVRNNSSWFGGILPYFRAGVVSGYELWAWVEPAGWLCVGADPHGYATAELPGMVKLATDVPVGVGAPVGFNGLQQLHVPLASDTVPGSVKVSTSSVLTDTDGAIGFDADGKLRAQPATNSSWGAVRPSRHDSLARVLATGIIPNGTVVDNVDRSGQLGNTRAQHDTYGMVKVSWASTDAAARNELEWNIPIGMRDDSTLLPSGTTDLWYSGANGHLFFPLAVGGCIAWESSGFNEKDGRRWSTGGSMVFRHTEQFVQGADGLALREATSTRLAGVYLATGATDARTGSVMSTPMLMRYLGDTYYTKDLLYTQAQVDAITARLKADIAKRMMATEQCDSVRVMTLSEYQALKVRNPKCIYLLTED